MPKQPARELGNHDMVGPVGQQSPPLHLHVSGVSGPPDGSSRTARIRALFAAEG